MMKYFCITGQSKLNSLSQFAQISLIFLHSDYWKGGTQRLSTSLMRLAETAGKCNCLGTQKNGCALYW